MVSKTQWVEELRGMTSCSSFAELEKFETVTEQKRWMIIIFHIFSFILHIIAIYLLSSD